MASLFCTGWGEGMRRGLNRRWALLNKIKQNKQQKLPVGGKTGQLARLGRAGQDKARQGKAGQSRAGQGRAGTGNIRQRTGTGLQTQGYYKGSK